GGAAARAMVRDALAHLVVERLGGGEIAPRAAGRELRQLLFREAALARAGAAGHQHEPRGAAHARTAHAAAATYVVSSATFTTAPRVSPVMPPRSREKRHAPTSATTPAAPTAATPSGHGKSASGATPVTSANTSASGGTRCATDWPRPPSARA